MTALHQAIAEYLGSAVDGLAFTESEGGNVFVDNLPSSPGLAVGVYGVGGPEADSKLPYDAPDIQILVRAATSDPRPALDMWARIYTALHGLRNTTLPGSVYLAWMLSRTSAPVRIGPDDVGRPQYSMSLRAETLNQTGQRA